MVTSLFTKLVFFLFITNSKIYSATSPKVHLNIKTTSIDFKATSFGPQIAPRDSNVKVIQN